ncbi:hypothetical protein GALL_499670 [mine drainage metagenome]|uniref:Uncharacterized protein n=1 Tax=mine drainage metagenome TaxID=410659 RepID=A0A1J5PB54_9ZZZZ
MALRPSMLVGCAGVIVDHHRCLQAQGIGPDTGLLKRVMFAIDRGAIVLQRGLRAAHQLNGILILMDEMDKGNLAGGKLFGLL